MTSRVRRWTPYALAALTIVGAVATRVLVEGRRELRAGDSALQRGDVMDGVRRLRRAAHWYLPGSPYCARAYERLESVALQAEGQARNEHAFAAWRAIRSSALATRWLIVPQRERLDRANRHIAALLADMPGGPQDRGVERARLREDHLALLTNDRAPEPAWIVVMAIGFAAWIAAAFWAARRGWDDDDRANVRVLALAGGVVAVGLILFVAGIANA